MANTIKAQEYVALLNEKFEDHTFTLSAGRKYHKVVVQFTKYDGPATAQRSVHCHVDDEGRVYKSAGWKGGPAKNSKGEAHIRYDSINEAIQFADPHGSYLYL